MIWVHGRLLLVAGLGALVCAPCAAAATKHRSTLQTGQSLRAGQYLLSGNGRYRAVMKRSGNFVVVAPGGRTIWASHTAGHRGAYVGMEADGNAGVFSHSGKRLWRSHTAPSWRDHLIMQDDGNLVVYTGDGRPLWSDATGWLGNGTRLAAAWSLKPGQSLWSANRSYQAIMQYDGNMVVYAPGHRAIWNSGTSGNGGAYLSMQTDGNLVVYSGGGQPLWASNTAPSARDHLIMQDDGNLVVYQRDGRPLWSAGTGLIGDGTRMTAGWLLKAGQTLRSQNNRFTAIMQHDGNFVVYAPGHKATWNSGTFGNDGAYLSMQSDGNLIVYSAGGKALWSSGTAPSQRDELIMQDDGNLVIYDGAGDALWSIQTGPLPAWWAPWDPRLGYSDEWDYTQASDEYGIDVHLNTGTPIYAPGAGHIFYQTYQQAGGWDPGRLVEQLSSGPVVAFGHVNYVGSVPRTVSGGDEIATVGYDAVQGEDPHHVEFMYDSTGGGGPSYYNRGYFMPAGAVSPANGCPHYAWNGPGSSGDPCAELAHLMAGRAP